MGMALPNVTRGRKKTKYVEKNGVERVKVNDDIWHYTGALTFLTLTAFIICEASLG